MIVIKTDKSSAMVYLLDVMKKQVYAMDNQMSFVGWFSFFFFSISSDALSIFPFL